MSKKRVKGLDDVDSFGTDDVLDDVEEGEAERELEDGKGGS